MMDDLISRQAAIDELQAKKDKSAKGDIGCFYNAIIQNDIDALKALPSAQPEIIHCDECRHSQQWYRDRRRCFLWSEVGVGVFDDGYCNYAERSEE